MAFPPAITEDRLKELLPALKKGDKKATDEVISGLLRLSWSLCAKWRNSRHFDDLWEQTLWVLTDTVMRRVHNLKDNNLAAYVSANITFAIKTYFRKEKRYSELLKQAKIRESMEMETNDELHEILKYAQSPREREVVILRVQAYKDAEIAEKLKITNSRVQQIRLTIKYRWENDKTLQVRR